MSARHPGPPRRTDTTPCPQVIRNLLKLTRTIARVPPDCAPARAGASLRATGLGGIARLMKQHSVKQPVESAHPPGDAKKFANFNRSVAAKGSTPVQPAESAFV